MNVTARRTLGSARHASGTVERMRAAELKLLTPAQVAAWLGVDVAEVRRLMADGTLPPVQRNPRVKRTRGPRIHGADVLRLIEKWKADTEWVRRRCPGCKSRAVASPGELCATCHDKRERARLAHNERQRRYRASGRERELRRARRRDASAGA